jgi:hypothetical protein
MPARRNESDIDRLYQLPLDEFTAARNALAKNAGADAASIRQLAKPPLAAWAVNQLYWRDRDVYGALVASSEELRRTNKLVLGGRAGDLRAAGRVHDQALDRALKATMAIVADSGHPASDATRQAILSTLRALPSGEAPGRLSATLQPGGFEMLAGFPIAKGGPKSKAGVAAGARTSAAQPRPREEQPAKKKDARAEARALKEAAAAAEALRKAEQAARREEFERARAVREADKAQREVERAREAMDRAREELEAAERAAKAADTARDRAERSARAAQEALARLRPL